MSTMRNLLLLPLILAASLEGVLPRSAKADYWLVVGSYRQGPGGRPEVSGITSPSIYAIPMETLSLCKEAGQRISDKIYKPVWQFDNQWTCIKSGS